MRQAIRSGMIVALLLVQAGGFKAGAAAAPELLPKETRWAWIYTASLIDEWESITGRAIVTVDGTKFTAKLFDAEYPTLLLFTLSGTVRGDQVKVRAIREHSDVSPGDYSGKIVTRTFRGFADYSGVQTIVLLSQVQHQIGLTRGLRS